MTAQLSREELQRIVDTDHVQCGDAAAMARMLLDGMNSEPVAYIGKQMLESLCDDGGRTCGRVWRSDTDELSGESRTPLFTAPPPELAVPDIATPQSMRTMFCQLDDSECAIAADVWNACRAAMLKAEPVTAATLPDGLDSSVKCWCHTCRPVTITDMRFVVCPDCGNKRCPRANDHLNACTGSNEPGQVGSAAPAAPEQEV